MISFLQSKTHLQFSNFYLPCKMALLHYFFKATSCFGCFEKVALIFKILRTNLIYILSDFLRSLFIILQSQKVLKALIFLSFTLFLKELARFLQDFLKPLAIKICTKKELRQYLPKLNFLSRFCNLKLFTTNPLKTAPFLGFPRLSSLFF